MPGATFLKGDKVNLRTVEEEDVEFLRDNINDPDIGKMVHSVFKPRNMNQQKEFFENVISGEEGVYLAICNEGDMKGLISVKPKDEYVGKLGIWIEEEAQGEGLGTGASKMLIDYAFNQLRYSRLFARALKENTASRKLWEKLGFQKEGEFREHVYMDGEFRNLVLYGLLRDEWK